MNEQDKSRRRPNVLGVHSIEHFALEVPDLEEARNFYSLFGLDVRDSDGALELYKGLSPDGGIVNYPLVQLTMQMVARADRFPADMVQTSREYFYNNLDKILEGLQREEQHVDPKWWIDIPARDKQEYEVMMQQARIQLRDEGYYDPEMLTLQRKVRCKMDASRAECTTVVE